MESTSLYAKCKETEVVSNMAKAEIGFILTHYAIPNDKEDLLCLLILALEYQLQKGDVCIRLTYEAIDKVLKEWLLSTEHFKDVDKAQELGDLVRFIYAKVLKPRAQVFFKDELKDLPCICYEDKSQEELPLVISYDRLYFRRYFIYEQKASKFVLENPNLSYYEDKKDYIKQALNILFPKTFSEIEWQKVAAAMATLRRFTIISGGPGTGKTTTVTKLLLLLLSLDKNLKKVCLCAPTGKAAARMAESLSFGLKSLKDHEALALAKLAGVDLQEEILAKIEVKPLTLHALIKVIPHRSGAIFNQDNPLECDILIVDEVSMLDLSLFNRLINALSSNTIVVMLGDRDQLNSVEAGSVLGDLCKRIGKILSLETLEKLSYLSGFSVEDLKQGKLSDEICLLIKSHRFNEASGIGVLSRVINAKEFSDLNFDLKSLRKPLREFLESVAPLLLDYAYEKMALIDLVLKAYKDTLFIKYLGEGRGELSLDKAASLIAKEVVQKPRVFNSFKEEAEPLPSQNAYAINFFEFLTYLAQKDFCLNENEALEAFTLLDKFRVLCSNRQGLLGDLKLNESIEEEVISTFKLEDKLEVLASHKWFPGRVVIITKNDPLLKIHNGDVGFAAYEKLQDGSKGSLRLFLRNEKEENGQKVKMLSPLFVVNHDSGFAMTIHKSQGSEYSKVLIVLSERMNEVISRELIYTAITRAKDYVKLICDRNILREGVNRDAVRESGLSLRIVKD